MTQNQTPSGHGDEELCNAKLEVKSCILTRPKRPSPGSSGGFCDFVLVVIVEFGSDDGEGKGDVQRWSEGQGRRGRCHKGH
jgi:hypothetical protein